MVCDPKTLGISISQQFQVHENVEWTVIHFAMSSSHVAFNKTQGRHMCLPYTSSESHVLPIKSMHPCKHPHGFIPNELHM